MAVRHVCLICHNEIHHAGASCSHCKARVSSVVGATPQLLVIIFAVMIASFVGTGFLNGAFRAERSARARIHLQTARTLSDYGLYRRAVAEFRDSLTYAPNDIGTRLGLAQSLYYLERFSEAENHLLNLIEAAPTLADANRLLARIAERGERLDDAIHYYRMAVHGEWRISPQQNRIRARFELIALLEQRGEDMQAAGELVDLLRESPADARIRKRIGQHFLRVGSPTHALQVFEELVGRDANDGEAFAGVGEAEFDLEQYYSARTAFQRALRLRPDDAEIQRRLELLEQIRALDPTYRPYGNALAAVERYRRAREVLGRVVKVIERCVNPYAGPEFVGPPRPVPGSLQPWFDQAREQLDSRRAATDDRIAAAISLAEELWARLQDVCDSADPADEPLTHVMSKLAA
ncbi:MAG: tetratricopeptide repeat protein [Acidobacteria bacterium]|nr:tetratricopeptide repeat protein [Acidobacteriota bacterium]